MKVIDTAALRSQVTRARLTGYGALQFPLDDIAAIAEELEIGRLATKTAGDLLADVRLWVEAMADAKVLDAERKRLRGDAKDLLRRIGELVDEPGQPIDLGMMQSPLEIIQ